MQELADLHAAELADVHQRLDAAEAALQDQQGRQDEALLQITSAQSDGAAEGFPMQLEASAAEAAALQRSLDEVEDRHREELETLSRRHAETLRALQDEWQETASCAQDEAAALQRRLAAAEAAAQAAVQLRPAPDTGGEGVQDIVAAREAEMEAERAAHAEELDAVRAEHEATLNGLAALHEAAIADVSQAHAADIARAEARHKVTSLAVGPSPLPSMSALGAHSVRQCAKCTDTTGCLAQATFEAAIKAHDAECASLVEAHAEAVAAAAMTHATEVEALRAAHAAELDLLRASLALDPAAIPSDNSEQPAFQQASPEMAEVQSWDTRSRPITSSCHVDRSLRQCGGYIMQSSRFRLSAGCTLREMMSLQNQLRAGTQEAKRIEEQFEARLAAQTEAHSAEVAVLRGQLAGASAQAAGFAERARAVGEDIAALKAALAIVQEEQRVQPPLCVIHACPVGEV